MSAIVVIIQVVYVCHTYSLVLKRITWQILGTQKDNMADCKAKERVNKGVLRPLAKLKESQVKAILTDTRSQREIAEDYNMNQSQISRIKQGKAWKHVRSNQ